MNRVKFLLGIMLASMLFVACSKDDNPIDNVNIDDPQEEVTDQPALVRQK